MLSPGSRLGPYAIVSPLGAGGMGEVYAATDTRLDRKIALKVLPPELAQNPERRARFEREARSIARLEHPHICRLHDVGENYLVMELLEGETLAQRLARGPLPLADIVRYGSEIAEALEKAHRAGVVHRDLKPSNVMLTKTGAKLLDFGLAKISGMVEASPASLTRDPSLTGEGRIVGSFPYMAPEQVEGRPVDHRTDIFALGAILYEMATGRRAFAGETHAAVISAILSKQPIAPSAIDPVSPKALDWVIGKCLEKDPDERWQSATDVALALRWLGEGAAEGTVPRRRARGGLLLLLAIVAIAGIAVVLELRAWSKFPDPHLELEITPPDPAWLAWPEVKPFAISPDGRTLAFIAGVTAPTMGLYLRDLRSGMPQRIDGAESALNPFWSADGGRVAFFQGNKLKEVALADGVSRFLRDVEQPATHGASWSRTGTILFANDAGVYQVDEGGGAPRRILATGDGTTFVDPDFLPDGEHFLLTRIDGKGRASVEVRRLGSAWVAPVIENASNAQWSGTGHILFVRDGALMAQEFDPVGMAADGRAEVIAKRVGRVPRKVALFSAARNGRMLALQSSAGRETELMHVGREFEMLRSLAGPAVMFDPALSHDATRVAVTMEDEAGHADIWIVDLARGARTKLPSGPGYDMFPIWAPDDRYIAYVSESENALFRIAVGGGARELLLRPARPIQTTDWSSDGETILLNDSGDISAFRLSERRLYPVVSTTQFRETSAKFSPDGEWIAYTGFDSAGHDVYVQRFRDGAFKTRVSWNGASHPMWSRDGRHLTFYPNTVVDVTAGADLVVSPPRQWHASTTRQTRVALGRTYGILPDETFVTQFFPADYRAHRPIEVLLDWTTRLPRRRSRIALP